MRILLVILAALIVAGGTGFYVMTGLQPVSAPQVAEQGPALKEVYVPATEVAVSLAAFSIDKVFCRGYLFEFLILHCKIEH